MLQLAGIHKRYGKRQVLRELSLELRPGEIYGLLGPNGAGKSTTLKVATGLVHPDQGVVCIDGILLSQDRLAALARVGASIDSPAFYGHLSGRRNLELLAAVAKLPKDSAERALASVGLTDRGMDKAEGYSTGMKQRLAIAATLMGDPGLLIFDEPTAGLDPDGRVAILALIRELVRDQGPTVLFTSHIFDEVAQLCDRAGILHEGELVHEGAVESAEELRRVYFEITGGVVTS